jgi:lipopolysaccharide transport system ATP-binding protein
MGEAAKDGRTVVFVSHNMTAVQELCGQTFLIQKGQIIEHGSTEKVISEYMSDALDSASGDFDYSHHPARQNQHQPIIRRVVLRGENGLPSTSFYPHSSLQIDLFIYPPSILRNPRLAVAIEDYVGRRIMTVASYFGQENFPDIADACCVRCVIPKLKLGTGRYLLSVSIATKYTGLLDSVDGGAWFDVSWQNNYSNGEVYQSVYGPVLVDSEWIKLS